MTKQPSPNPWLATRNRTGREYDAPYMARAAAGQDVHGEANLVEQLLNSDEYHASGKLPYHVLDAGCGTGRIAIELARRGFEIVGVDLDDVMLTQARAKAPPLDWRLGDLSVITLDAAFDAIVMAGNVMIYLTPGTEAATLENMARHLKPGGLIIAAFELTPQRWTNLTVDAYDAMAEAAGLKKIVRWLFCHLGMSCASSTDPSDVHLFKDAFALFTFPHELPDLDVTVPAFNLTTLLPTSSKLMLNVQIDDYGIVEERECGCPLQAYGYTTHLRDIRSYSKLVGEGVTLIGNELLTILEKTLPARFGGSALDYQLLEREDEKGFTRLYLAISPRVRLGVEDEQRVVHVILNALRDSSPMADAARTIWQTAQTIQIKRMEPILTARGKLLPLHVQKARQN